MAKVKCEYCNSYIEDVQEREAADDWDGNDSWDSGSTDWSSDW